MTDHARRPLLFLDVDGQLLPFGADPQPRPRRAATSPHLAQLSPDTGIRPAALPCTLVWATTWQEDANTEIAPRIGLPHLPVVTWPEATQLFGHAQRIVMPLTERMASDLNCAGIFLTGGGMGRARPFVAAGYRCGMNDVEQVPWLWPEMTVTLTVTR